ncbi:hypothetical protein MASR2M48_00010 [Spirochaetota bacterium]
MMTIKSTAPTAISIRSSLVIAPSDTIGSSAAPYRVCQGDAYGSQYSADDEKSREGVRQAS